MNVPCFEVSQAGWYSVYLIHRNERLGWPWSLVIGYTHVVQLSANSHLSTW